jgi:NAD(P)-dependent dehydrogenase (short-subunit alcohol dehydrogenase family)
MPNSAASMCSSTMPGFATDVAGDRADDPAVLENIMLGRLGRPQEIVSTTLYLASDQASFTTGANIRVDGGCLAVKL